MQRQFRPLRNATEQKELRAVGAESEQGKCFAWNGAKPLTHISIQNRNLYFGRQEGSGEREVRVCRGCMQVTTVLLRGSPKTGTTKAEHFTRAFLALACPALKWQYRFEGARSSCITTRGDMLVFSRVRESELLVLRCWGSSS